MALTSEQQRKVYLHLGVLQVSTTGSLVGGVPMLTEATHQLQTAIDELTTNGETSVIELLTILDAQRSDLHTARSNAGVKKVDEVEFFEGGAFGERRAQYNFWRGELARLLGVPLSDPSAMQGPSREP